MIRFEPFNKFSYKNIATFTYDKLDLSVIREVLETNQCIKILMGDKSFYCYQEYYPEYLNIDFALTQLNLLENLSLHQLWENKINSIVFEGCNEWVIELFFLLKRENVDVRVESGVWEIIYGDPGIIKGRIKETRINANLYKDDLYNEFSFVMQILQYNKWKAITKSKHFFSHMGANFFICTIPEFEDLEVVTSKEIDRHERKIVITNGSININDDQVITYFRKIYGESWKEIRQRCTKEPMQHWLKTIYDVDYYLKNKKIYSYGINRCYLIGPCIVEGSTSKVGESFPDRVQQYLDMYWPEKYAVMTISIPFYVVKHYLEILKSLSIRSNDIIICMDEVSQKNVLVCSKYYGIKPDIEFKDCFDLRKEDEIWFADRPIHASSYANRKLALYLIERIKEKYTVQKKNCFLQRGKGYLLKKEVDEIDEYLKTIDLFSEIKEGETVGAIVMNCNPLTLGHEYLIEYARALVDKLYIFVVQEDRSYIPFEDRIYLVRQCVKKWSNVKVNPSGTLILSSITMPLYFEKEQRKDEIVDAWKDIEIFAQYIAPRLKIAIRFVGEERTDRITYQYNREMERTLNDYGIKMQEIPRKELDGVAISASCVRKYMTQSQWEEVKDLVSQETYTYLLHKFGVNFKERR